MDTETEKPPRHLEPLIQPTPSSAAKLLVAWDGLLVETQIAILTWLPYHPPYLNKQIQAKALASESPYIRYLAATLMVGDAETEAIIKADPDPLVRYSRMEGHWLDGPEEFWALPHEARLAKVRSRGSYHSWEVEKAVSYALDNLATDGQVSADELDAVLRDYVLAPQFLTSTLEPEEIEALWRLVPKLSAHPRIAYLMIARLPPRMKGRDCVPKEVIEALTDPQVETLLLRPDVALNDVRREIYWAAGEDSSLRAAASSSHFSIDHLKTPRS